MRISGGSLRGRTFYPPANNWPTRPTTDISRTALFNILNNLLDFEEVHMLDLFGGTGAHSYEMVSRGCTEVTYVDKFIPATKFVQQKINEFKIDGLIKIVHSDYLLYIKTCKLQYDYIFAGPPYGLEKLNQIPDQIFQANILKTDGLFVLEHNPEHDFTKHPNFWQQRNYGQTIFSFFRHDQKSTEEEE